jgi:hypothetical protein
MQINDKNPLDLKTSVIRFEGVDCSGSAQASTRWSPMSLSEVKKVGPSFAATNIVYVTSSAPEVKEIRMEVATILAFPALSE